MQNYPIEQGGIGSKLLSPVPLGLIIIMVIGLFCFHIYSLGRGQSSISSISNDDSMTAYSERFTSHEQSVIAYPVQYPDARLRSHHPAHPPY